MFLHALCDKMFPALAEQTVNIPFPFQFRPSWITAIWYHGNSKGKARLGIVEEQSFKALNQSALMDDLCLACMYGLVWLEHLSLFCQQQIRLLATHPPGWHDFLWLAIQHPLFTAAACRILSVAMLICDNKQVILKYFWVHCVLWEKTF